LTKNAEFADWTYIIWSTQVVEHRIPDYTQKSTMKGICPLTATLYFWNEANQVWDDYASTWSGFTTLNNFITTNSNPTSGVTADSGKMSVKYTNASSLKPFTDYHLKIVLEDLRADNACAATVNQ